MEITGATSRISNAGYWIKKKDVFPYLYNIIVTVF